MTDVPRLVVAAPASGSGKTTVATGLMAAFVRRGLTVSPHKVGPDYIDPGYHTLATGRPGRNLDAYLCGEELLAPLFAHGAAGADLAVVEGVMGLFDGAAGLGELASTAHVAKLLRAPVVLVVDASSQARSVAALVHGFASWDPEVRVGGVILNKVGSDRHEEMLREALDGGGGVPVLGALRRADGVRAPSRHLGLVPAAERGDAAVRAVEELAARVGAGCDLRAVLALAKSAPWLPCDPWSPATALDAPAAGFSPTPPLPTVPMCRSAARRELHPGTPDGATPAGGGEAPVSGRGVDGEQSPAAPRRVAPVVAVAGGPAFTFAYAEHTELLRAAGATVATFDPLRDEALPDGTAGLVIGGGFPEAHAADLAANEPLRKAVAAFTAAGGPVAAECAGLLYLARELDGAPMCGVLDATARMTGHLTLGYREAVAVGDSALAAAGTRVRGHEFHRTALDAAADARAAPAWGLVRPAHVARRTEGFVQGNVHASYLHVHWAAAPELARRFTERCAA